MTMLLVFVIIAIIALAINQRYHTGRERHPELLSEFSNIGVFTVQAISEAKKRQVMP